MAPAFTTKTESSPGTGLLEQEVVRLYRDHVPALWRYAASFVQNQEGASDAVQEVFLRYFVERHDGRQIGNPRAWLYHVLRNYLLDCQRTVANREVLAEDLDQMPSRQQNPERMLYRSETARELASVLSQREFECLRLRAEGFDYAEIAGAMGIRTGTVGALLARVQRKIRRSAENDRATPLGTAEAIHFLFEMREPCESCPQH